MRSGKTSRIELDSVVLSQYDVVIKGSQHR